MCGEIFGVLLDDVREAAEKMTRTRDELEADRERLYAAISAAVAEGIPKAAVARAAGLSAERVGQIVRGE